MSFHRSPAIWLAPALALALVAPTSAQHLPKDEVVQAIIDQRVELQEGRLRTQLKGQPWVDLFSASETLFFIRVAAAELDFQVDDSGAVASFILRQNGQTLPAEEVR